MCGITGFNWDDKKLVKKMTSSLRHRGPDDFGIYTDRGISLGHRRLSIIDLSKKGKQPMTNENGDIIVVFNGEIYNFKELKDVLEKSGHKFKSNSDTEVIVHGYEEYKEKIIEKLDGMFAFALWDAKKKKLILARDKIGIKSVYYYFDKKKFIFASEIKAILLHELERNINYQAVSDYLELRHPSGEETILCRIKRILPGEYLVYEKGKIKRNKYWKFPEFEVKNNPDAKKLDKIIESSIKKRLMSDVPVGVFLSGGLDSSTMVAYLSRFSKNIKTFSIGFDDPSDEVKYAEIVAEKFNTEHKEIISSKKILELLPKVIWNMDEPLADPASAPTYLLSREVSKYVKVILAGDGGDEVFGGYQSINSAKYLQYVMSVPWFIRKKIMSPVLKKASTFFNYPKKQMAYLAGEVLEENDKKSAYKKIEYLPFEKDTKRVLFEKNISNKINLNSSLDNYIKNKNLINGIYEFYFKEWVPNDLLLKADKMSMAHGLEIRVPYLDTKLVEFSAGLDNKYKQNRYLFRKIASKMLPKVIMNKKKQGFTLPISNWFINKDFYSRIKPHLEDLKNRGIFNDRILGKITANPSGFKNDHRLWVLLNLELWSKIYLDGIDYKKIKI